MAETIDPELLELARKDAEQNGFVDAEFVCNDPRYGSVFRYFLAGAFAVPPVPSGFPVLVGHKKGKFKDISNPSEIFKILDRDCF